MLVYGNDIGYKMRIVPGFFLQGALFLIIPFLTNIGGDTAYYSVFCCLLVFGLASGICQGTIFGMAARFPGPEMGLVMFGNGVAGLGANVLKAISLTAWP